MNSLFGLVNAPSTFQRIMSNLFRDEIFKFMVCYLDDVVVYSKTYEEHVEHVEIILKRLEKVGLRLNSSKCNLFMKEITFLGMNISENGIRTNQEKTRAISEWPRPRNLKELRSFLGVGSYYRKFIKGYSTLVSPLTLLTKSGEGKGRISKRRSRRINLEWNDECEVAMKSLKSNIIEAPVLSLPKYGFPFILETDASDVGLGAVLSQRIDGKLRTIAFASRTLSTGEKNKANYSSKKLEFIAIVWAVSDQFRHYLMGSKCTVYTDNSAVAYISRKGELTALEHRWVARLAPFDLDIKYRAGSLNRWPTHCLGNEVVK